jgi:biopolymer transport protein ExbD
MNKSSRRTRRMARHHALAKGSPLNLVSLMDIFTILVFFLLVNSSSSVQLPSQTELVLPKSTAKKVPKETPVLVITPQHLVLQGQPIMTLEALQRAEPIVPELLAALLTQSQKRVLNRSDTSLAQGQSITLMGDENLSFALLNKILNTCQQAQYTDIAFAAHQTAAKPLEAAPK